MKLIINISFDGPYACLFTLSLILLFYFMFLLERHSKSMNDGNSTYSEEDDNPLDVEKVHEQPVAQHADKTYNPNRYYIFMHVHRCI